jgi:hypothetical protein
MCCVLGSVAVPRVASRGPERSIVRAESIDRDRDGRFEAMLVRTQLRRVARGRYRAIVSLSDVRGQFVAYGRPPGDSLAGAAIPFLRVASAREGPVSLAAWFDGEAIGRRAAPGPLTVHVALADADSGQRIGPGATEFVGRTRFVDTSRFGPSRGLVRSLKWGLGTGDTISASVELEVPRLEAYTVEANAWRDSVWLGRWETRATLRPGRRTVVLAGPISEAGALRAGRDTLRFEVQVFVGMERRTTWGDSVPRSAGR